MVSRGAMDFREVVGNGPPIESPETPRHAYERPWRNREHGAALAPATRQDMNLWPTMNSCGLRRATERFSAGGRKTLWISNTREDDARLMITEVVIRASVIRERDRCRETPANLPVAVPGTVHEEPISVQKQANLTALARLIAFARQGQVHDPVVQALVLGLGPRHVVATLGIKPPAARKRPPTGAREAQGHLGCEAFVVDQGRRERRSVGRPLDVSGASKTPSERRPRPR